MSAHWIYALDALLLGMLLVIAVTIARQRNLFVAAMLASLYSLLSACLFVLLDAVDVAFTEASVGAGISTVLILGALALTAHQDRKPRRGPQLIALLVCLPVGLLLILVAREWPPLGSATTAVQQHPLTAHYLQQSPGETGIPNAVTSVLASYRGYDTLGEVTVIFTAGLAVLLLLWGRRRPPTKERD